MLVATIPLLGLLLSGQAEAAGFTPTKQDAKEKA